MFLHNTNADKRRLHLRQQASDYSRLSPLRRVALKCKMAKKEIDRMCVADCGRHRSSSRLITDVPFLSRNNVAPAGWNMLDLRGIAN